jgi:lysosomal-associated membrane protein 1/2
MPKQDKATIQLTKIQFDAFRASKTDKTVFQEASPCPTGGSNDLVPIIVGCVLAGMVVVVLVAYLVGRRYRANKYKELEDEK